LGTTKSFYWQTVIQNAITTGVMQTASLRIVGLLGTIIFAAFFSFTYSIPGWVESFAADFIDHEVSELIDSRIDGFELPASDNTLSQIASALYQQNQQDVDRLKAALKDGAHEKMADALAQIRDMDCECRDKYAQVLADGFEFNIALLQLANDRIVDFIQGTYMEVVAELKHDIRIFTGTNTGIFLLLLLVSFLKPRAIAHLFLPGALLALATLVCTYFYIFEQNWLLTIIYGDYLGFAYLAYLGVVFLVLCDIVFNKGRITTRIVNAFLNAVGSATSLLPC
jgi:hypothetical protein